MRTRGMRLVVFAAALALLLVSGLVGGAIWIAATPGDQDRLEEYQWSASEQAQSDQAIAAQDSSLLPACTEDYFAWREETKAARESAGRSEPVKTNFWSAPGCRGIPDRLVEGPASESGPKAPTASPQDRPVIDVDYDDSWVADFPDVIGGYRVVLITTPKSVACTSEPLISLQAIQESMDEFLSTPPDLASLRAAIRSVPGVPSHFTLSFVGPAPIDEEEVQTRIRRSNEANVSRGGCIRFTASDGLRITKSESPVDSEITGDAGGPPQSDREAMDPQHSPVFDVDYDDSWVANVPEVIGGYRVLYIITPKSVACSPEPVILLQAPQESMDEFLSAPLDVNSLSAAIRSIPGAPSHFNLSFGGPIDREAFETRIKERNELAVNRGWCHHFVDPDGPVTPDPEPPDDSEKTGDAGGPQQSDREVMDSQDRPVIDVDYDDSWVQYVPEVIGGHQVLYIDTPKSRACSSQPVITLLTPKDSVAQFLGAPPDVDSLIRSVPGLPPDISLSFTNNSLDTEAKAGNDEQWNARMVRNGCLQWMHPDGGIHD